MGRLEITMGFFPLQWVLYFVTPFAELDGQRTQAAWGTRSWEVAPGMHQLRLGFPYITGDSGVGFAQVPVYAGHVTSVRYDAPWLIFMAGSVTVSPQHRPY